MDTFIAHFNRIQWFSGIFDKVEDKVGDKVGLNGCFGTSSKPN